MKFANIYDQDIYLVEKVVDKEVVSKSASESKVEEPKITKPAYKLSFLSKASFTSELSELLGKIIAATKVEKNQILVKDNVSEINEKYSAEFNILLGDIDSSLSLNSPTERKEFTYFQTHTLEEIRLDNSKKGILWNTLKGMLNL